MSYPQTNFLANPGGYGSMANYGFGGGSGFDMQNAGFTTQQPNFLMDQGGGGDMMGGGGTSFGIPESSWGGMGGGQAGGGGMSFFGQNGQQGYGGMLMGGLGGVANLVMGMKQYGLAKKTLAENKRQFELNYGAQSKLTNAQMADRQAARVASNPGAYQSVGGYMAQNGIK